MKSKTEISAAQRAFAAAALALGEASLGKNGEEEKELRARIVVTDKDSAGLRYVGVVLTSGDIDGIIEAAVELGPKHGEDDLARRFFLELAAALDLVRGEVVA